MNQHAISLIFALLAGASSLATGKQILDDRNVDWDGLSEQYNSNYDLQITKNILINFNVGIKEPSATVKKRINNLICVNDYEKYVQKDLRSLVNPKESCTQDLIDRVLQICLILHYDDTGVLDGFTNFLMQVGKKKLGICAAQVVGELNNCSEANKMGEKILDELFVEVLGLEGKSKDAILRALKSLDLRHSEFDIRKCKKVLWHMSNSSESALIEFKDFMSDSCSKLWEGRSKVAIIISLASTFRYRGDYSTRVSKLIEYHRLCLSLRRADLSEKVMINLEQHITKHSSEECY